MRSSMLFYVERPNLGLAPPPYFGYRLTAVTQHQHIGAKRRVLWPSNYSKMRFWPGLCLNDAPPGPLQMGGKKESLSLFSPC